MENKITKQIMIVQCEGCIHEKVCKHEDNYRKLLKSLYDMVDDYTFMVWLDCTKVYKKSSVSSVGVIGTR